MRWGTSWKGSPSEPLCRAQAPRRVTLLGPGCGCNAFVRASTEPQAPRTRRPVGGSGLITQRCAASTGRWLLAQRRAAHAAPCRRGPRCSTGARAPWHGPSSGQAVVGAVVVLEEAVVLVGVLGPQEAHGCTRKASRRTAAARSRTSCCTGLNAGRCVRCRRSVRSCVRRRVMAASYRAGPTGTRLSTHVGHGSERTVPSTPREDRGGRQSTRRRQGRTSVHRRELLVGRGSHQQGGLRLALVRRSIRTHGRTWAEEVTWSSATVRQRGCPTTEPRLHAGVSCHTRALPLTGGRRHAR